MHFDGYQHANDEFRNNMKNLDSVKQRETALQNLTQGHTAYMSLKGNLEEGMKVRNDIVSMITK
jgi:hypothetical protein